jgi:hypothetical protein
VQQAAVSFDDVVSADEESNSKCLLLALLPFDRKSESSPNLPNA